MNFTGFSKRTFPLIALFAASALSVTAEELTVTTAEELREKLTTKGTLDGNTVKLGVSPFILESEPPASEVIVDDPIPRTIVVLANVTVAGTSPADTVLQTTKNGDAFALAAVTLNFHSMAIAGSGTSSADADGRAIYLVGGGLVLSGGIEFKDRYFSAVPMTAFGASGGAIHSSNKLDKIDANTTAGAIVFSGITTFGNTFSKTDESTGTTSKTVTPVLGGAVHLAGAMRVSGANGAVFNKNRAVSLESDAFGGAVYITNVAYAIDGTQSGIYDPNDPVTAGLYGFAIAESSVSFSQNVASGARVIGGAVAVSGGAMMSAGNSSIQFSENSAKGTGTSVFGGALAVVGSGVVSFGKGTLLAFSKNTVESSGEFASAGGGGFYLEGSSAE
ncbi:MAG: hypothetical protein Q4G59_08900, partial [Planctomycetia bacterium]|nr:hypothetical protein [Planctomycetia bacterium]